MRRSKNFCLFYEWHIGHFIGFMYQHKASTKLRCNDVCLQENKGAR
uniref:Uncharacterized protein n=1 Tax=Ascaris lumbricoides TaxID=6252 RepID=A0A0M3INU2_ASCLU